MKNIFKSVKNFLFKNSKDEISILDLQEKAKQGDAKAQVQLAVMYLSGTTIPQDKQEAARLFRLAAEQGNGEAQSNLAMLYLSGNGVMQDME